MQRDRRAVATSWLAAAERDRRAAEAMSQAEPSIATFHAQQAAEKAIKAVLVLLVDDHPRTHAATTLVRELIAHDASAAAIASDASSLDIFYLTSRYPDSVGDVDPGDVIGAEDARRALDRCDRILGYVRTKLTL